MAYSLNDVFRPLRIVMRVNGFLLGLLIGLLLLFWPGLVLERWSDDGAGSLWAGRMVGGLLLSIGISNLLSSLERVINIPSMVTLCLANGTVAAIVITAYLQQTLRPPTWFEQIALVVIFVVALVGAVFPISYIQAEYKR